MKNISAILKKFTNKSLKNIMFATSLIFIVACSNGKIEISDIENSLVGEYSCQHNDWILPGNEFFVKLYRSGPSNIVRTPYGIAYELNYNTIHNFKGGSSFLGKIKNELLVSRLDDMGKIKNYEHGPWNLINDNQGNIYFSADKGRNVRFEHNGINAQNFNQKEKSVTNYQCRRDTKKQEEFIRLIEKYKKQFQK
jgi:hypothetical protein